MEGESKMKLQDLDRTTLDFLIRACQFGIAVEFQDTLFENFFRNVLQRLISKLTKAKERIREAYSVPLAPEQAICIRWTLEIWNEQAPDTIASHVLQQYFSDSNINVKAA